jgi:NAD(P)-dependent dehydrogenase (short-subunit alcohol dehydrogenase family)
MAESFEGRVALVTGGTSGIGRATAIALARAGADVVVAGRSVERADEVVAELKSLGSQAMSVPCDVTRAGDVERLVERTLETYNRLDVAVNSAGIFEYTGPTAECQEEDWDRTVDTDLKGVWLSMKYEIPPMLAQGRGAIVNVAGAFGLIGFPGAPAYVAAKHGVVGLTKAAALEYATTGVRVNAGCPGLTRTPLVERATGGDPVAEQEFASHMPIGRMASAEEVAAAVLWMCSDDSSFLLGHALALDGGWVVQ